MSATTRAIGAIFFVWHGPCCSGLTPAGKAGRQVLDVAAALHAPHSWLGTLDLAVRSIGHRNCRWSGCRVPVYGRANAGRWRAGRRERLDVLRVEDGYFDWCELPRRAEPTHESHDRLFNVVEDGVHSWHEHQRQRRMDSHIRDATPELLAERIRRSD